MGGNPTKKVVIKLQILFAETFKIYRGNYNYGITHRERFMFNTDFSKESFSDKSYFDYFVSYNRGKNNTAFGNTIIFYQDANLYTKFDTFATVEIFYDKVPLCSSAIIKRDGFHYITRSNDGKYRPYNHDYKITGFYFIDFNPLINKPFPLQNSNDSRFIDATFCYNKEIFNVDYDSIRHVGDVVNIDQTIYGKRFTKKTTTTISANNKVSDITPTTRYTDTYISITDAVIAFFPYTNDNSIDHGHVLIRVHNPLYKYKATYS